MPASEIAQWKAYEQVTGPLGTERADLHMAILAAVVANTASRRKRKPADFLPKWDRSRQQSWQEQLQIVKTLHRRMSGTTKAGGSDG